MRQNFIKLKSVSCLGLVLVIPCYDVRISGISLLSIKTYLKAIMCETLLTLSKEIFMLSCNFIMRPSSLGGGRILRRTLSVCLSVCPSVRLSVRPVIDASVTSRHLANYDTHVLFGKR